MHARLRAILMGTALAAPSLVHADPTEPPVSVPPEPRPPAEVTVAKKPPPEPVAPAPGFTWEPFGFMRLQYIAVQDDPNVTFVGRDDGFELQNARIGVRGKLADRAAFVIAFDGAVDERAQINTPEGKLRVGLRDAYLDTALSGQLVLHTGYFQAWLDPMALVPDTTRDMVDLPIESRGMRATEGYQTPSLPPGRSLGTSVRLDPAVPTGGVAAGFEIAIQNGADEYSSNNDNNLPALSAALVVRFPHDGFLMVAGRFNPRTIGMLPFRQDETDYQGAVGVRFNAGPAALEAGAIVQHTTYETTGGPSEDRYGAHAQLMIRVNDGAQNPIAAGYRFGVLDPSSLIVTDRVMEHTAALLVGVPRLRMRFQLQLTHVQEQAARDLANDRIQLAAEVVL